MRAQTSSADIVTHSLYMHVRKWNMAAPLSCRSDPVRFLGDY